MYYDQNTKQSRKSVQPSRTYTSKHKSKARVFSPEKSEQSDVMIFVEDIENSPDLKSAKSNAPRAPRGNKNGVRLRIQKNEANQVAQSCQKMSPESTSYTPTLDGRPNRLYISSPKCETPKTNQHPVKTPIAVLSP